MKAHRVTLFFVAAAGAAALVTAAHATTPAGRYVIGNDASVYGDFATVYDTKTKLTWERVLTAPNTPAGHCEELANTIRIGWRLPTLKELATLVDYAGDNLPSAMIDLTFFPNTPAASFQTSTTSPGFGGQCIDFSSGYISCGSPLYVRCVR
jgi:hypothetical protein